VDEHPTGFTLDPSGGFATIDPVTAMRSPAAFQQALHMLLAAYAATGMAVAGVHALMLLRGAARDFHRRALTIALLVGAPAAVLQPLSGDVSARVVATTQPVKLAALEGQWATERGAPLRIGGWPDAVARETRWALEIPYGLSLLAFHDPSAEVKGLRTVAPSRPSTGGRGAPRLPGDGGTRKRARARGPLDRLERVAPARDARAADAAAGARARRAVRLLATEAGWIVTEVGRQPWVVQGLMRTSAAVTPMPGLVVPMLLFILLYLGLGAIVVALIASLVRETARTAHEHDGLGLPEVVAAIMVLALNAYALTGGADFGGGVWDLLARGPPRSAANVDRRADRADLGGEPRLADPRRGDAVHRLPRGVRRARHRPAHPAHPDAARHRRARILVRVPQLRRARRREPAALGSRLRRRQRRDAAGARHDRRGDRLGRGRRRGGTRAGLARCRGAFVRVRVRQPLARAFPLALGVLALAMFAFLAAVYLGVREPALRDAFRVARCGRRARCSSRRSVRSASPE
jgi:hypothetical protein